MSEKRQSACACWGITELVMIVGVIHRCTFPKPTIQQTGLLQSAFRQMYREENANVSMEPSSFGVEPSESAHRYSP